MTISLGLIMALINNKPRISQLPLHFLHLRAVTLRFILFLFVTSHDNPAASVWIIVLILGLYFLLTGTQERVSANYRNQSLHKTNRQTVLMLDAFVYTVAPGWDVEMIFIVRCFAFGIGISQRIKLRMCMCNVFAARRWLMLAALIKAR